MVISVQLKMWMATSITQNPDILSKTVLLLTYCKTVQNSDSKRKN